MADPRRKIIKYVPKYKANCAAAVNDTINKTSARKGAFGALGKIGDLEVLNDIGAGKVGEGLRTMASVSNSIRDGSGGANPGLLGIGKVLGTSAENGANWVLDNVGVANGAVALVNKFNPAVANAGYSQAERVYDLVKDGNFEYTDIPTYLQEIQSLDQLANKLLGVRGAATPSAAEKAICAPSPYASDLVFEFAPKHKFLFVVQFVINSDFATYFDEDANYAAFVVQRVNRPNIRFEYEEVNMYNFRTKVLKRSEHEDLTISMYDDNQNKSMQMFTKILNLMSPVTNIGVESKGMFETSGMSTDSIRSGSIRELPGSSQHKTIFDNIIVYHVFDYGKHINKYNYLNPKIVDMKLDELDMSSSETPNTEFTISFDSVNIENGLAMESMNLTEYQKGLYKIGYNGSGDQPLDSNQLPDQLLSTPVVLNAPAQVSNTDSSVSSTTSYTILQQQTEDKMPASNTGSSFDTQLNAYTKNTNLGIPGITTSPTTSGSGTSVLGSAASVGKFGDKRPQQANADAIKKVFGFKE